MRSVALLCSTLLIAGCASGSIQGISAPNPDAPELEVQYTAKGFAHVPDKVHIVARYGPYFARANPVVTGSQPVQGTLVLNRWERIAGAPASDAVIEVWFSYPTPRHAIDRKSFLPPFTSLDVIENAVKAKSAVPRTPTPGGGTPSGWGRAEELSASLDEPSQRDLRRPLICEISADGGPRYFKVQDPPSGLVRLTIDVRSKADAANVNEATWWRVSLLDEAGMALPHEEQEFVGLGQEKRHVAEWRFDGSPVVFKLASGSKQGDWIRIRFEEVQD